MGDSSRPLEDRHSCGVGKAPGKAAWQHASTMATFHSAAILAGHPLLARDARPYRRGVPTQWRARQNAPSPPRSEVASPRAPALWPLVWFHS